MGYTVWNFWRDIAITAAAGAVYIYSAISYLGSGDEVYRGCGPSGGMCE